MANTTTAVGRLQLAHPDLGGDGGVTLHTQVRSAWTRIADNMNSRFYIKEDLLDSTSQDFEHNFKCAFDQLNILLYSYDDVTENLTRIVSGGSPDLDDFTIVATPGALTTQIRVTNNTGSTQDIALVVTHGKGAEELKDLSDVDPSGAEDGQALVYNQSLSQFVPGASGDSSLKLQSISGTDLTIKSGFMILSDGRELRLANDLTYDLSGIVVDNDYYLYIDLTVLPGVPTNLNGREVYDIENWMFTLSTTTSEDSVKSQYAYIGTLKRSGGVWSNNQTGAVRRHNLSQGDIAGNTIALTASQIDTLLPISHGLNPAIPDITLKVSDGTDYEYHDHSTYFKADATEIKSTGTTLTSILGGSTPCILTYAAGQAVQYVSNRFWKTRVASSNEAINSNDQVFGDTSGGAFTLTMPLSPSIGDLMRVIDYDGSWDSTNKVILDGNGKNINGNATLDLTTANDSIELVYNGVEWRVL